MMDQELRQQPHLPRDRNRLLRLIALLKFAKCGLLVLAGTVALELHQAAMARFAHHWGARVADHFHAPALAHAIQTVSGLDQRKTIALGAACFAYAALFLTEGIGLWRDRRWAEYLTVIATASLLPLEVFELLQKVTWPRVLALVVNLLILGYLVRRLLRTAER